MLFQAKQILMHVSTAASDAARESAFQNLMYNAAYKFLTNQIPLLVKMRMN